MSKRELKPGDRVRVYGGISNCLGQGPRDGTVGYLHSEGMIEVTFDKPVEYVDKTKSSNMYVHPKQCRRLKPRKAKPKREEGERQVKYASRFAVDGADSEAVNLFASHAKACRILQLGFGSIIRLVECSESEVPVSRADLAKAFGQAFCAPKNAHKQMDSDLFEAIAAALFTTSERGKA